MTPHTAHARPSATCLLAATLAVLLACAGAARADDTGITEIDPPAVCQPEPPLALEDEGVAASTPGTAPAAPAAPASPASPAPAADPPAVVAEGRVYQVGPFESVEIGGAAEVRYVQGDSEQVWIGGGPEVQRTVSVSVSDGLLRIRSEGNWRFWAMRRLQVQIVSRQLARLAILGAADVRAFGPVKVPRLNVQISGAGLARFDQLHVDYLGFSVSGAGDGQMSGQARELNVSVAGKSEFRGENLQTSRARVSISGIGNVKVWAQDDLSVSVAGVGNVDYWGSPRVRLSTSGPGSITPRGAKLPLP